MSLEQKRDEPFRTPPRQDSASPLPPRSDEVEAARKLQAQNQRAIDSILADYPPQTAPTEQLDEATPRPVVEQSESERFLEGFGPQPVGQ